MSEAVRSTTVGPAARALRRWVSGNGRGKRDLCMYVKKSPGADCEMVRGQASSEEREGNMGTFSHTPWSRRAGERVESGSRPKKNGLSTAPERSRSQGSAFRQSSNDGPNNQFRKLSIRVPFLFCSSAGTTPKSIHLIGSRTKAMYIRRTS